MNTVQFTREPWAARRQRIIGILQGVAAGWLLVGLIHKTPLWQWDMLGIAVLMMSAHLLAQYSTNRDVDSAIESESAIRNERSLASGEPARRRSFRFAFTLRTLLVVVTMVCICLAYQVELARERRAFLTQLRAATDMGLMDPAKPTPLPRTAPPGLLWLVGEQGVGSLIVFESDNYPDAKRLFPEAHVRCEDMYGHRFP